MENVVKSNNREWGFLGTVINNTGCSQQEADDIWQDVCLELIVEFGLSGIQAGQFLDSKSGRHIADAMTHGNEIKGDLPMWTFKSIESFLGV